jgi:membrane protein DedA with SNARE-associated domain
MSCATYLASGVRAVLVWFPLYLLLGRVLARRPWAQTAYLWLSGALAAVFVVAFTSGQWVD